MIGSRSITRRVALAFGLLVAISAVSSTFVVHKSLAVRSGVERSSAHSAISGALAAYRGATEVAHLAMLLLINSSDIAFMTAYQRAIEDVARAEAAFATAAARTGGDDSRDAAAALAAIRADMSVWQAQIAARQIADLDDPATVDVARLREVSPENQAIRERVDRTFSDALAAVERRLDASAVAQGEALSSLLAATAASGVLVVLVAVMMALVLSRTVSRPLRRLATVTERLKDRDWSVAIGGAGREDEIGLMSRALEVFREDGRNNEVLEVEQRRDAEEKLRTAVEVAQAVSEFRRSATGVLREVASAGRSLGSAATALEDVAGTSLTYTSSVSRAAEATGASVGSVASAVEEMSASIREISSQMHNVSLLTREATSASEAAGRKVAGLRRMSENITSVIALINGIAGQINLLALNATIESARAGEAGKGFAVVASEVKQLADRTAKATEEITRVIDAVRGEVAEVVSVIDRIGGSIGEVSGDCAAVAAAVEQQSAALDEIAQNLTAVSTQTLTVATNVRGVEEKVSETRLVAGTVSELSAALKSSSDGLSSTIELFIAAVANDPGQPNRAA